MNCAERASFSCAYAGLRTSWKRQAALKSRFIHTSNRVILQRPQPDAEYFLRLCADVLRKTTDNLRIIGLRAEIRIQDLQKTKRSANQWAYLYQIQTR
jgi:hypothetical protein